MKRFFYLLLCLLTVLSLLACGREERDYTGALRGDFQAVLRGERQGVAFEATAQVRLLGDGTRELRLFYVFPEALRDVSASALLEEDGQLNGGTATLRGVTVPMEEAAAQGLLTPLLALLTKDVPETVQGEGNDTCRLNFSSGRVMRMVRRNGVWIPCSYACEGLFFEVIFAD